MVCPMCAHVVTPSAGKRWRVPLWGENGGYASKMVDMQLGERRRSSPALPMTSRVG